MSALEEIAVDLAAERAADRLGDDDRKGGLASTWFEALTIGEKVRAFFAFNLAFALLAGLFVVFGHLELGDRAASINKTHANALAAERLVVDLSEAQRHTELLIANGDLGRGQSALDRLARAEAKIEPLRARVKGANLAVYNQLGLIGAGIEDFRRQISTFDPSHQDAVVRERQATEVTSTGSVVLDASLEVAASLGSEADRVSESGTALLWTLLSVWIGLTIILTLLTLIAERYLNRNVSGTLTEMTAQMCKLASGDKDVEFPGKERKDELGQMARAMEVFHRAGLRLERLSRERAERSKAELDEQARRQSEREEARLERDRVLQGVADQFERTVGDVVNGFAAASTQLQTTSKTMAETAEKASRRTEEVAQSMGEANRGATAAAAACDEFALSIGEISQQAASSARLARKATTTATEADTTISALSDSAQEVGQIVELIQSIAQRTNLLALNASIEAARGGEAGRGFAVVASEVKELAMQTSRATEQISGRIQGMQQTTSASVDALRTIAAQVAQLETTAIAIASAVDQQSVAGQDLAHSTDLAARETERVVDHMQDVSALSLSTGSAAAQVLESATDLELQSSALRGQVDQFLAKVRTG